MAAPPLVTAGTETASLSSFFIADAAAVRWCYSVLLRLRHRARFSSNVTEKAATARNFWVTF